MSNTEEKQDVYTRITNKIIASLESSPQGPGLSTEDGLKILEWEKF